METLDLFTSHYDEPEAEEPKEKEARAVHRQPEVLITIAGKKATVVFKNGDHFEKFEYHTETLSEEEFAVRVKEQANIVLGSWYLDEKWEQKMDHIKHGRRADMVPLFAVRYE